MSKILIINYFFPPIQASSVVRNYNFALNIAKRFEETHVLTTTNRRFMQGAPFDLSAFKIHTARTFDYQTVLYFFRKNKGVGVGEGAKTSKSYKFTQHLFSSYPTTLLIGIGGLVYLLHGFWRAYWLIKREKIDVIVSSYNPNTDHFLAFLLKKCFPRLIWIADFRDLPVEPVYKNVYLPAFQHRVQRFLLRPAHAVTTVSEGLAKHLEKYHPRVHVFRNSIAVLPERNALNEPDTALFPKFTIAYTGSMVLDERKPDLLLSVIKRMAERRSITPNNFQFVYAGKDGASWLSYLEKFGLAEFNVSKGLVSFEEAGEIQRKSHLNLLLTSATSEWTGVLTGKFFEYLAAMRPIIVLINGSQDLEFENIIQNTEGGIVVYHDRSFDDLVYFLTRKMKEWRMMGTVESTTRADKLRQFTWEYTAEKYYETLLAPVLNVHKNERHDK